jgi:hypothetical protein
MVEIIEYGSKKFNSTDDSIGKAGSVKLHREWLQNNLKAARKEYKTVFVDASFEPKFIDLLHTGFWQSYANITVDKDSKRATPLAEEQYAAEYPAEHAAELHAQKLLESRHWPAKIMGSAEWPARIKDLQR